ncbi:MAG: hypothetical protein H0V76_08460 [Blastocatellia bacterium]|nr:hypothetical protein [Blastocatellia bacterium]
MPPFSNLVSESLLINATIDYLSSRGGRAPAVRVVDRVMKIRGADPYLAKLLVSDLVERDSRLRMDGDVVIFAGDDHESIDLNKAGFVIFDLETTGAKAPPCRITEVGAFRVVGGCVVEQFHSLVNPEMPIPPFITSLTGISDLMVVDKPKFGEIAADLLSFIGDSVMVAHNARFDMGFLNHEIGRVYADYRLANPSLCTVQLSRRLLPDIENHKLKTVAGYYSIDLINHHRATDDAYATAHIFINLLGELSNLGIRDVGGARRFSNKRTRAKKLC